MRNRKIKIIFDANPVANSQKTGIGVYSENLLKSISKEGADKVIIYAFYFNFLNRKKNLSLPQANNIKYRKIVLYPGALVNTLRRLGIHIPVEVFTKTKANAAIYPNYLSYPSIFKTMRISIVHDLTHEFHPEYMSKRNREDLKKFLPSMLDKTDLLITISNETKKSIKSNYSYKKDIIVTPIPLSLSIKNTTDINDIRKKYSINKKYILFVGTLEPRKNLVNLMEAFASNEILSSEYSLVLCGKLDWKYKQTMDRLEILRKSGLSIISTGFVDEITKNTLYKYCSVFVMPSYYEGFGMPIIEASYFGANLALSDIPVFHEVAGNNADYFNPNKPIDIAEKILSAINKKTSVKKLPYDSITWNDNAKKILEKIYDYKTNNF